jgi:hypothetical protein
VVERAISGGTNGRLDLPEKFRPGRSGRACVARVMTMTIAKEREDEI